jgi:hypothetical protein
LPVIRKRGERSVVGLKFIKMYTMMRGGEKPSELENIFVMDDKAAISHGLFFLFAPLIMRITYE